MNRIIQLILFLFLIILIAVFYDEYFNVDDKTKIEKTPSINKPESPKGNNLIKNLKY